MSTKDILRIGLAFTLMAVLLLAAGCGSDDSVPPDAEVDRGGGEALCWAPRIAVARWS